MKPERRVHPDAIRKIDIASLILIIVGIVCGAYSAYLFIGKEYPWIVIVPSISTFILGAKNIFAYEAPRDINFDTD